MKARARRHGWRVTGAAALASASLAVLAPPGAGATPSDAGEWSAPFDLGGISIHAGLMHNDEVLYFQYVEGNPTTDHTSLIKTWNYRSGTSQLAPITYHRDLFCAGMNILPDGRMYISGGHAHDTGKRIDAVGTNQTDTYDPATRTWTPAPNMVQKRWYPTAVGMPNGHTYVFGGGEKGGLPSNTVEDYDPRGGSGTNGTMTTRPSTATKNLGWYPRMHLLADGRVVKTAPAPRTVFFKPATDTWVSGPLTTFGTRLNGASVLLPGGKKVLMFGGHATESGAATASAEILDTSAATPTWRTTAPLNAPRVHANAVVLPDGKVLAIGGGAGPGKYTAPNKATEMFDPATETWTTVASQSVQRMYHATALLLPDGRVLSSGSDSGTQATTGEIYSPPYLFRGPRPSITGAPATVGYGQSLSVTTDSEVTRMVLIHPGAVTHQVDTDQRSVPLSLTGSAGSYTVNAPANANVAPPGYYMLFALNADGVPSVARWVKVG